MEKKIINKDRYKKTISINKKKRDLKKNLKDRAKTDAIKNTSAPVLKVAKIKNSNNKTNYIDKKNKNKKLTNIITCIILLTIIAILSRVILKHKDEPFFGNILKTNFEDNYNINVGVVNDTTITNDNTKDLLINELDSYAYRSLLKVDSNYNISYDMLNSIVKISNTEYVLNLKEDANANYVQKYLQENNRKEYKYYDKLKNIKNIKEENNIIYVTLNESDPTFIYNLNIPIITTKNTSVEKNIKDGIVSYTRSLNKNENKNLDQNKVTVNIKSIDTIESTVNEYKNGKIDSFVTTRAEIKTMLGKYEYNIKGVRTGEGIYLIGNKDSNLFSKIEVRRAIAYSIDRDDIIKEVAKNKASKIDLPYIYDEPKYKYDIYAAENVLLSAGYKKTAGIYRKYEKKGVTYLKLTLVVNSSDETKVKIANSIKEDLENIGIGVNIKKYSGKKLDTVIKNKEYDIALITINVNEIPSISFINNYLNINENINNKIKELDNSNVNDVKEKIENLRSTLSSEVAIIGIYSDVSYYISKKDIEKFSDISYMNIFKELF